MRLSFGRMPALTIGFLIASFADLPGLLAQEPVPRGAHRAIVGWDDSVICVGPGTVAGMDTPGGERPTRLAVASLSRRPPVRPL